MARNKENIKPAWKILQEKQGKYKRKKGKYEQEKEQQIMMMMISPAGRRFDEAKRESTQGKNGKTCKMMMMMMMMMMMVMIYI